MDLRKKLECLSLASLSKPTQASLYKQSPPKWSTFQVLHSRFGSYPQTWDWLERRDRGKHSSLLRKSVNYGRKRFYSTGHRGQHFSLLWESDEETFCNIGTSITGLLRYRMSTIRLRPDLPIRRHRYVSVSGLLFTNALAYFDARVLFIDIQEYRLLNGMYRLPCLLH